MSGSLVVSSPCCGYFYEYYALSFWALVYLYHSTEPGQGICLMFTYLPGTIGVCTCSTQNDIFCLSGMNMTFWMILLLKLIYVIKVVQYLSFFSTSLMHITADHQVWFNSLLQHTYPSHLCHKLSVMGEHSSRMVYFLHSLSSVST